MFAPASTALSPATIPTKEKSRTASILNSRQPRSHSADSGICASTQTIDNSSLVRVTEKNSPCNPQAGTGSFGLSRQIPYRPGTTTSVSCFAFILPSHPASYISNYAYCNTKTVRRTVAVSRRKNFSAGDRLEGISCLQSEF